MSVTVQPDIFPGAALVQLNEWGYPMGSLRPTPPADKAFSVIHITANLSTAAQELAWRKNDPALQNSATFFVNRDGSVGQALGDPLRMDPWANGDVRSPDTSNPRIAAVVADGVNANERTLVAIENVGNEFAWGSVPGGYPITDAQIETDARIIAHYHGKAGVPINRQTVIGHYQLNSVTRANCPSKNNKALIDKIVARAQELSNPQGTMADIDTFKLEVISIDANANIRSAPSDSASVLFMTKDRSSALRVGTKGDWSAYWIEGLKKWGYTQTSLNVLSVEPYERTTEVIREVPTGITLADVDGAVRAALVAFNKNLDVWASQRPTK